MADLKRCCSTQLKQNRFDHYTSEIGATPNDIFPPLTKISIFILNGLLVNLVEESAVKLAAHFL